MRFLFTLLTVLFTLNANEGNTTKEIQDMSDPLAVYTQAGAGYTDRGVNIKIGKSYDSGKPATMAMNVIEIGGIAGKAIGFRGDATNKIDFIRFRNFVINTKNGLGTQVDVSYNLNTKTGSASYALIQALPKMNIFQFYPLAGLGLAVANNVNENATWADTGSPSGIKLSWGVWFSWNVLKSNYYQKNMV